MSVLSKRGGRVGAGLAAVVRGIVAGNGGRSLETKSKEEDEGEGRGRGREEEPFSATASSEPPELTEEDRRSTLRPARRCTYTCTVNNTHVHVRTCSYSTQHDIVHVTQADTICINYNMNMYMYMYYRYIETKINVHAVHI